MYHRVADSDDPLSLHPDAFVEQMKFLADHGYRVLDVVSALDLLYADGIGPKDVALTFDDGFRDVAVHANDVLAALGFSGTVFVSTDVIDGTARYLWSSGLEETLNWDEIRRLDGDGCLRFEPHGLTHTDLTRLDDEDSAREILVSKVVLESRLGREARAFCYPGGFVGLRDRDFVGEAGFAYGISCEPGLNTQGTDRLLVRRIQVYGTDELRDFEAKVEGSHDRPLVGRRLYRRARYGRGGGRPGSRRAAGRSALPTPDHFERAVIARIDIPPAGANEVDIVVSLVTHNATERTLVCLDSLLSDVARRCSAEFVVIDNASDIPAAPAITEAFPEVRVIEQTFRDGFGANHNRVIRATKSRHVLVLNNDTTVPVGTLDALVDYLDATPKVGIIGPKVVHADGIAQPAAFGFPSPRNSVLFALLLGQVGMVQSAGEVPKSVDWVSGAAMGIRRAALDEVGLFDDGFFMYHEDTDLCLRLWKAGFDAHYVPTSSVVHDHWGTTRDHFEERIDEAQRSRRRYWAKHHSRFGERVARYADASRYAAAAAVATIVEAVPKGKRPLAAREWDAAVYRYNARSVARRTRGVGLREMADAYNSASHAGRVRSTTGS